MMSVGLQTHIWNNRIASVLLLLGFPFLLLLVLGVFFALNAQGSAADPVDAAISGVMHYGHYAVLMAIFWFTIAWFTHTSIINASVGSRSLSREEAPEIYNLLENLCISRGMPMPKLRIMETPAFNAFASGINDKTYCVTLTRGIIDALEKDELEAVIGHELSHIRHQDVRLLIIAVIFAGIITFSCEMIYRTIIYGARGRRGGGRALPIGLVVLAVGYVLAIVLRFALSRRREYLADAGAVELTKNPDAMIRALQKISGHSELPGVPDDIRQMMIENKAGFLGMFSTHPPIEDRIAALVMMGGQVQPIPPSPASDSAVARPWRRRYGPWG